MYLIHNAAKDYDGNLYDAIVFPDTNQAWLTSNLKTTHLADGTALTVHTDKYKDTPASKVVITHDAYGRGASYADKWVCCDPTLNENQTGCLYDVRIIINNAVFISNWQTPTMADFDTLFSQQGLTIKDFCSQSGWNESTIQGAVGNNQSQNNSTLFSIYPAGYWYGAYDTDRPYSDVAAKLWTKTTTDGANTGNSVYGKEIISIRSNSIGIDEIKTWSTNPCSVRLIYDGADVNDLYRSLGLPIPR